MCEETFKEPILCKIHLTNFFSSDFVHNVSEAYGKDNSP